MSRYDDLLRLQQTREALEQELLARQRLESAWDDCLRAYTDRFVPRRGVPHEPWTTEELTAFLHHMARMLRRPDESASLPAFGKGDFPTHKPSGGLHLREGE